MSGDRRQAIEPKLFFFFEGFAGLGGDFLNPAYALLDEDHFAQRAVSGGQEKSLVIGRFVDDKKNYIVFVRGRDIESLHLSAGAHHSLDHGALLFVGHTEERGNVRGKFSVHTFL